MALTRPRAYQIYDIDYKQSVRVVTVSNITLAGGAPNSVDGVNLTLNDRILVTGQSSSVQNGIYYVTTVGSGSNGTWSRSIDTDATGELLSGTIVMVTEGTVYADTQWKLITNDPITIGVTGLTFVQNYLANSISYGQTAFAIGSTNANATVSVAGTSNVVVWATTGEYVTGIVSASGNITGGNLVTTGAISTTGNAVVGNILTNGYYYANGVAFGGGGGGGTPGGANTQIQYNNNGTFGGSAALTFNNVTNAISASGTFSATGNITGGNILTVGIVSTGSNVISGNGTAAAPQLYYINAANTQYAATLIQRAGTERWLIGADNSTANGNVVIRFNAATNYITVTEAGAVLMTGNVSGGNLLATTTVSAASYIGSVVSVTGAINGAAITGTSLTVSTGNITGGNIVNAGANGVGNIGTVGGYFNTVFAKATSAQYADVAEWYSSDQFYEPGTVVSFGGTEEVTLSSTLGDNAVAGVVSTNPAYIMNAGIQAEYSVPVALTGRVPTKVVGTVRKGNMMISAGNGYAQACATPSVGTVIGKAIENFDGETGVIEVVVGRL